MEKKKQYEHPSAIVILLSGKDRFMDAMSGEIPAVRRHRGDIDWEEE